ncbi:hypothetical protein A0H81_10491 [Grifola frondosa]|uniref:Uncharacterized protein n=1 Tax=Grifola frondosa TaxID=5627 RepID=A0A1C7LXS9_GRIFR|nr:hypothetical protein A0H81_10491 [Grifola frondosa]
MEVAMPNTHMSSLRNDNRFPFPTSLRHYFATYLPCGSSFFPRVSSLCPLVIVSSMQFDYFEETIGAMRRKLNCIRHLSFSSSTLSETGSVDLEPESPTIARTIPNSRAIGSRALSLASWLAFQIYYHCLLLHFPPEFHISLLAPFDDHVQTPPLSDDIFQDRWSFFLCMLLKQWKILTAICGGLLSTSVALLQVSDISQNPLTNAFAIISMVCALTGLLLGLVHFFTLYNVQNALLWIQDAAQLGWRSVSALLAAPAAWLAWSAIAFLALILAYVWRAPELLNNSDNAAVAAGSGDNFISILVARLVITAVVLIGMTHVTVVTRTVTKLGSGGEQRVTV